MTINTPEQISLFDCDPPLAADDVRQSGALALRISGSSRVLSAAAKGFNLQLQRVEKLKSQLSELESLRLEYLSRFDTSLTPLKHKNIEVLRLTALWIDDRLQRKGLGKVQRRIAIEVLCDMAGELANANVPGMAQLHDKYSEVSLAEIAQEDLALFKDMMENLTGASLPPDQTLDSLDDLLNAHAAQFHKIEQERAARKQAAAEKKKVKKGNSPAKEKAEQLQQDASGLLRQLFRQLASSLHPDKEKDEALRLKKTALMSEANAAYDRKDLVALMQLQLQAALVEPSGVGALADEKLAAFTLLLKEQVADLERQRVIKQQELVHDLNLPMGLRTTRVEINRYLEDLCAEIADATETLENDRKSWETSDLVFKRWLNDYRQSEDTLGYFT